MKEILRITVSLTAVCVAAALILGAVFTQTDVARKRIEKAEKEEIVRDLLGFGHGKEAPSDLVVHGVHRYVISDQGGATTLGYVVPVKGDKCALVQVNLSGNPLKVLPINAKAEELADAGKRDPAVNAALPKGARATYAETFYIADRGGKRLGYVLPGVTQGFKTFVNLMVSLDPGFTVTGVAITRSEEDPGLGDEIKQDYFRNQFVGKTQELLKDLKVVKEPLPSDYLDVLDPEKRKKAGLKPEQVREIKQKHVKDDIYALTGATISSNAVTRGVKDTVRKFVYRFDILNKAIEKEKVEAVF
jgi:electron transport complex protein RnfG